MASLAWFCSACVDHLIRPSATTKKHKTKKHADKRTTPFDWQKRSNHQTTHDAQRESSPDPRQRHTIEAAPCQQNTYFCHFSFTFPYNIRAKNKQQTTNKNTMRFLQTTAIILLLLGSSQGFITSSSPSPISKVPVSHQHQQQQQQHEIASSSSSYHHLQRQRSSSSTELHVSATATAAITGALTGGLFAGGLHAIAGTSSISYVETKSKNVFGRRTNMSLYKISFCEIYLTLVLLLPMFVV